MTARQRFIEHALQHRGAVVCWGFLDCSELVALALMGAGGQDRTKTHRAQTFADETPNLVTMPGAEPKPGDLVFYGADDSHIIHVAILLEGGRVLSADGATSRVTDLAIAKENKNARVREHDTTKYRGDFVAIHRNRYVDDLDVICL